MSRRHGRRAGIFVLGTAAVAASAAGAASFGAFEPLEPVDTGAIVYKVAVGDLNRDGIKDLAGSRYDETPANDDVIVMLGKRNGTFKAPDFYESEQGADGVAIGQLNDDKRPDIALANLNLATVSILHGKAGGGFEDGPVLPTGAGPGYIAPRDLNGDGRTDLVVANYYEPGTDAISVLLRDDSPDGWADEVGYDAAGPAAGLALGTIDDGKRLDVITQTDSGPNTGTVSVLLGNADGTFDDAQDTPVPGTVGSYENVTVADFNRDGDTDVATGLYTPSELDILLGNGDGTFADPHTIPIPGAGPQGIAAGDYDRDGKQDLAYGAYDLNELHVLRGKGNGTFKVNPVIYPLADNPEAVIARKVDENRSKDLISGTDSSLEVFLNQTP